MRSKRSYCRGGSGRKTKEEAAEKEQSVTSVTVVVDTVGIK